MLFGIDSAIKAIGAFGLLVGVFVGAHAVGPTVTGLLNILGTIVFSVLGWMAGLPGLAADLASGSE